MSQKRKMKNIRKITKSKYFLNFIEEFWEVKREYQDWQIGRVEIYKDDEEYAINELRFATPSTKEWFEFRDKWDFKEVEDLAGFEKKLKKFRIIPGDNKK